MPLPSYQTLEEIHTRKDELRAEIQQQGEQIGELWHGLFEPQKASTKGELVTTIISHSITAVDAFLLVRKLMKNYGGLFTRGRGLKRR